MALRGASRSALSRKSRLKDGNLRPGRADLHPGVVGDSPYWSAKPAAIAKYTSETPLGRLTTMAEIVDASVFLLENTGVNGVDLIVDGGWHCR